MSLSKKKDLIFFLRDGDVHQILGLAPSLGKDRTHYH